MKQSTKIVKICEWCSEEFLVYPSSRNADRFCSIKHGLLNRIENLQLMTKSSHLSHHMKGKPKPLSQRQKMSQWQIGKQISEQARLNMSIAQRKRYAKVKQMELDS